MTADHENHCLTFSVPMIAGKKGGAGGHCAKRGVAKGLGIERPSSWAAWSLPISTLEMSILKNGPHGSLTNDYDRATNAHFPPDKPKAATGKSLILLNR